MRRSATVSSPSTRSRLVDELLHLLDRRLGLLGVGSLQHGDHRVPRLDARTFALERLAHAAIDVPEEHVLGVLVVEQVVEGVILLHHVDGRLDAVEPARAGTCARCRPCRGSGVHRPCRCTSCTRGARAAVAGPSGDVGEGFLARQRAASGLGRRAAVVGRLGRNVGRVLPGQLEHAARRRATQDLRERSSTRACSRSRRSASTGRSAGRRCKSTGGRTAPPTRGSSPRQGAGRDADRRHERQPEGQTLEDVAVHLGKLLTDGTLEGGPGGAADAPRVVATHRPVTGGAGFSGGRTGRLGRPAGLGAWWGEPGPGRTSLAAGLWYGGL